MTENSNQSDPCDEAPLPSLPVLTEEETARQLRDDFCRGYKRRAESAEAKVARLKATAKNEQPENAYVKVISFMRNTLYAVRPLLAHQEKYFCEYGYPKQHIEDLKKVRADVDRAINLRVDDMPQSEQQKQDPEYPEFLRQPAGVIIRLVQDNKEFFGGHTGDKCLALAANKLTQLVQEWKSNKASDNCVAQISKDDAKVLATALKMVNAWYSSDDAFLTQETSRAMEKAVEKAKQLGLIE